MTEEALDTALAEPTPAPVNEPTSDTTVNDQDIAQEADQNEAKSEEPKEQPKRSRREALEQAFAKLDGEAEGKDAKDADVKGQNGEPTGPQRGPDGKFVAKEGEKAPEKAAEPAEKPQEKPEAKGPDTFNEAPSRFSADAKAEWEKAPQPIRAETHRAIREMEQGIQQYKQRVEPLEPFFKAVEQQGGKLEDVVGRFFNLESMIRQNPVQGFSEVARNMGLSPQQVGQMLMGQQPGQSDPRDQEINQLRQQVQQLQQGFGGLQQSAQQQREQEVYKTIETFRAENPRFDELEGEIARMLETGYAADLADAYEKADRLNPAPAPQPEPAASTPPAQTREALSVTGAPTAGSNPAQRKPSANRQEAVNRAMRRAGF